jgi:hypothetical protein
LRETPGSPLTNQPVWSLAEALELTLLNFRRGAAALPRSVCTKLCKGFVRTIMWFPHTSEPWLAGSRAPRAAAGRRVCPVRAIPASRMLIARHLPEHALIGDRRSLFAVAIPRGPRTTVLLAMSYPDAALALVADEPAIRVDEGAGAN